MGFTGFRDVRVVEVATGIAGPYAGKLLADLGADVVKVEPAGGDPTRRRSASGAAPPGEDSALFRFLNTSKRSVVGDLADPAVTALVADADVVVDDGRVDAGALLDARPSTVVASVTPYGCDGPLAGRPWTEFTVQAEGGSVLYRGTPDKPPYQAGGRLTEWTAGAYLAAGAAAALTGARRTGAGAHVDCAMVDVLAIAASTFSDLLHSIAGRYPLEGTVARSVETPSIEPAEDGWIGFNTNAGHMFQNFLLMIERPDLLADEELLQLNGRLARMDEWTNIVRTWTTRHPVADILRRAGELRIPVAQVHDGETILADEHLSARGVFVENPAGFVQPRPPVLIDGATPRPITPAPALGADTGLVAPRPSAASAVAAPRVEGVRPLPFAGLRVVDLTSWWAGPAATQLLATLGAEVIHVESTGHPDGMRTTGFMLNPAEWWEWSHMYAPINTGKLGITLDLGDRRGNDLLLDAIRVSDVVVENFSPRVTEQWGLTWDVIHEVNPRAVFLRMPAFGLSGPWRDRVGFAQTMEQMSGMAWMTGPADEQPRIVRGPCDPIAGMHAATALIAALEEVGRTGVGVHVEAPMIEAAVNCAAEPIVERSAYGAVLHRDGNRSPDAAPQGLYACRGTERWLAVSVTTDQQWRAFVSAVGSPRWSDDERFATRDGRRSAHDELDARIGAWTADRDADEAAALLLAHGVPAARAWDPRELSRHPQLVHRRLYEELDHPTLGRHPFPGLPFRWTGVDRWLRSPAPTLGQHTREFLGRVLGTDGATLDALESDGVIGTRPKGF